MPRCPSLMLALPAHAWTRHGTAAPARARDPPSQGIARRCGRQGYMAAAGHGDATTGRPRGPGSGRRCAGGARPIARMRRRGRRAGSCGRAWHGLGARRGCGTCGVHRGDPADGEQAAREDDDRHEAAKPARPAGRRTLSGRGRRWLEARCLRWQLSGCHWDAVLHSMVLRCWNVGARSGSAHASVDGRRREWTRRSMRMARVSGGRAVESVTAAARPCPAPDRCLGADARGRPDATAAVVRHVPRDGAPPLGVGLTPGCRRAIPPSRDPRARR
jgi:hypothetical protein